MYFTREPIIESVVTPASGYKLVLKPSSTATSIEYRVDAVEIVSFPGGLFYRNIEGTKTFLVPAKDYEIVEVRESRLSLKLSSSSKEEASSQNKSEGQTSSKKKKRRTSKKKEKPDQEDSPQESPATSSVESPSHEGSHSTDSDSTQQSAVDQNLDAAKDHGSDASREASGGTSSIELQEQSQEITNDTESGQSDESKESSSEKPKRRTRRTQRRPRSPRKSTRSQSDHAQEESSNNEEKRADSQESLPNLVIPPPPGLVSDILSYEKIPSEAIKEVSEGKSPLEASIQTSVTAESEKKGQLDLPNSAPVIEFSVED